MQLKSEALRIKLFADGADVDGMIEMSQNPKISGLTTNPTLMRKAGIENYEKFAKNVLRKITEKPISFEVFSDDFDQMIHQALKISSWGENVYVKIPVTNSKGVSTRPVYKFLSYKGVKLNVTALMTEGQVQEVVSGLNPMVSSYVSVFAGRIADTGRDPVPIMQNCLKLMSVNPNLELIWASPRELLNIFQADEINCHIITATNEILGKLNLVGRDLIEYSLETVKMFRDDAVLANYKIDQI